MNNLILRKSKTQGIGVFTAKTINKNDKVFKFAERERIIKHLPGCHCKICCRCIQIAKFKWLYPEKDSYGWYLNHNCRPSCGIKGRYIVALRKINPNEEITIDYSTTNTDSAWKMKCLCKSNKCRKIIRSVQFLPKNLFNKYKNYMSRYVKIFK